MSQFDDLLADFGGDSSATSPTLKATTNGTAADDFDPFGGFTDLTPSNTTVTKSTSNGGTDSQFLLDFSLDSQAKNGDDPLFQVNSSSNTSPSANPLYEMSADTQSSNPLYDLSSGSANPLYDLSTTEGNGSQSANPLYDLSSSEFENGHVESSHVESGLSEPGGTTLQDDLLGLTQESHASNNDANNLLGDFEDQNEMTFDSLREQQSMLNDAFAQQQEFLVDHDVVEVDQNVSDVKDQLDSQEEAALQEEEIIQDGVTVSKTTKTENYTSDSGPETLPISPLQTFSSDQWVDRSYQNAEHSRGASEQDIIHFTEMSSVKSKFESPEREAAAHAPVDIQEEVLRTEGGVYESTPQTFTQWQNEEEEEEGVYESQPVHRADVVREADKDPNADLPARGTAQSIKAKFLSGEVEGSSSVPRQKRELTPPAHGIGGEFVSEPRAVMEQYEGKAEAGVFESQPAYNPEVVSAYTQQEEALPEQGFAKNVAARFKEIEKTQSAPVSSAKREITPDRSGRVEFVSEPRNTMEHFEGRAESGVFESQPEIKTDIVRSGEEMEEPMPERGSAKNLASKFRQMSMESSQESVPRGKREITPDYATRGEYVSEPRGQLVESYEAPKVDAGVFENQPEDDPNVVKSDSLAEEYVPESGFTKNVAAKFREMESTVKSPTLSPGRRKEFTPPREEARTSGVYESTPEVKPDLVTSGQALEEALPERGTAKNMAQRFRQMESAGNSNSTSPRPKKEFTPPPQDSGVFESKPNEFRAEYNSPPESGIIENTPAMRSDVTRGDEPPKYEEELPERGMARNLVGKWRQMESQSAKATSPGSAGRVKEFTPPRDEPRIAQQRKSPRTPMSPTGHMDNGSVHPSDLPGQYQPLNEPSVFESTPEVLTDVTKEDDTDWMDGMPKKDAAKKMLAKFQQIQEKAKSEEDKYTTRKDSESSESSSSVPGRRSSLEPVMDNARLKFEDPDKVGRSKSMRAAIQTEKCAACEKTVYAMEKLEMNKQVYHKTCFRCSRCRHVLTPKTYAVNNGVIFCNTHYKQMFTTKGNYDEGFGRSQHKKLWSSQQNISDADTSGSPSSPDKS